MKTQKIDKQADSIDKAKTAPKLKADACSCGESEFLCYPEDGQCVCGTYKHHVHCKNCYGVSQWG